MEERTGKSGSELGLDSGKVEQQVKTEAAGPRRVFTGKSKGCSWVCVSRGSGGRCLGLEASACRDSDVSSFCQTCADHV
jgi:hypothetical protein